MIINNKDSDIIFDETPDEFLHDFSDNGSDLFEIDDEPVDFSIPIDKDKTKEDELTFDETPEEPEIKQTISKNFQTEKNIPTENYFLLSDDMILAVENFIKNKTPFKLVKSELASIFLDDLKQFCRENFPYDTLNKRVLIRYRLISKNFLNKDSLEKIFNIPFDMKDHDLKDDSPFFYLDEWFENVVSNNISLSSTINKLKIEKEFRSVKNSHRSMLDRISNIQKALEKYKEMRRSHKQNLQFEIDKIVSDSDDDPSDLSHASKNATRYIAAIKNLAAKISSYKYKLGELEKKEIEYAGKIDTSPDATNLERLKSELSSVSDMIRFVISRDGINFPFLTDYYLPGFIISREKIIEAVNNIVSVVPDVFRLFYRGLDIKRIPFIIILPVYGNHGFCWEPFEHDNISTGRGRLIIPMYSRQDPIRIITEAIGDYFWMKNREISGIRWMEEGITAQYMKYHHKALRKKRKDKYIIVKPDLQKSFVQHFTQWILDEPEGRMKIPNEVRNIFWFKIPFSKPVQTDLANKTIVYRELLQKKITEDHNEKIT